MSHEELEGNDPVAHEIRKILHHVGVITKLHQTPNNVVQNILKYKISTFLEVNLIQLKNKRQWQQKSQMAFFFFFYFLLIWKPQVVINN